jgi:arylsulfatase A-like enzyme
MKRRDFLAAAAGAALPPAGARPNVLIILADDLGWADAGFQGSEIRTPNLDKLAGEGVRFERFYSFPLCSPTRSALMTGRSPVRLGVAYHVIRPWSNYGVPLEEHFMPQSFQAEGYYTAMAGKWHLGHAQAKFWPNARGFEHSYGHVNGAIDYYTHMRDGGLDWHRNGRSVREEGYSTDLIAAEAVRLIEQRDPRRPLFLYLPFNAPHSPLQAPEALIDKYAAIGDKRRRTFAAMVDALDAAVGRVLAAVEKAGMAQNTLVLFFSDNGGPTGGGARNTPLRGAKNTTFEGGIRVPAVMRWPGVLKPGVSSQVMTVLDVFPTLADAAGVGTRNKLPFDGRNLWGEIRGGRARPREDLFFLTESQYTIFLAAFRREWKLVRELSRQDGSTREHLFRIEQDPEEKENLAERYPEVVRDLAARIERWRAPHPFDGVRFSNAPPAGWKAPAQWAEAAVK